MNFTKREKEKRRDRRQEKETKTRSLLLMRTDLSRNLGVSPEMLKKGEGTWGEEAPSAVAALAGAVFLIHSFYFCTARLQFMNGFCSKGSCV